VRRLLACSRPTNMLYLVEDAGASLLSGASKSQCAVDPRVRREPRDLPGSARLGQYQQFRLAGDGVVDVGAVSGRDIQIVKSYNESTIEARLSAPQRIRMPTTVQQLNVSITPHFSRFIRNKIKSGRYSNASEVVREALRRLEQEELIQEQAVIVDPENFEEELRMGFSSIERGRGIELRDNEELREFFADIIARGKKRLAARKTAVRK